MQASITGSSTEEATDGVIKLTGNLNVQNDGVYTFNSQFDDGFLVKIDGVVVFSFNEITSPQTATTTIDLDAGEHFVEVFYWDQGGEYVFEVELNDSDGNNIWIAENLSHVTDPTSIITTDESTPIQIDILANDSDPDGDIDESSVVIESQPANGHVTVNTDGTVVYVPNDDFSGVDSFTYTVLDETGNISNTATVQVNVTGVAFDAPIVIITEDINDDGTITNDELVGQVDVTIIIPEGATIFDTLNVTNPDGTLSNISITQDMIDNGYKTTYDVPEDGESIVVSATVSDLVGNVSPSHSDTAIIGDTTAGTITLDEISGDIIDAIELTQPLVISGTTTGIENGQIATVVFNGKSYTGEVLDGVFSVTVPANDVEQLNYSTTYIATANVSDFAGNA
ncbi:Ig-like domain-containing protein [Psychromonas sp. KJ10-10]|uniref:Ig-like domain-containing protein n=1 Tax=Psychromonas sp. KJ10-10 TaxID=3391823 RepID=UPI0039B5291C